jgi:hypothetical protein
MRPPGPRGIANESQEGIVTPLISPFEFQNITPCALESTGRRKAPFGSLAVSDIHHGAVKVESVARRVALDSPLRSQPAEFSVSFAGPDIRYRSGRRSGWRVRERLRHPVGLPHIVVD